jgi:hypothetical protein
MGDFGKDITQIAVLIIGIAALSIIVGNAGGFATSVTSVGNVFNSALATASSAGANVSGGGMGSTSYQPMSMSTMTGSGFAGVP